MNNDVLRKILATAASSCRFPQEIADLQRSIIFVSRQFCSVILDSPLVSLNEALEVRDPLAANVALRHAANRPGNATKDILLGCPHVVGAALRLRGRRPRKSKDPFDVYVDTLAGIVKRDVGKTFGSVPSSLRWDGMTLKNIINDSFWRDEWRTIAGLIVKRGTINTAALIRAANVAFSKGHTECLKLLTEYMPEFICTPSFIETAISMKRGCDYLAKR